MIRHLPTYRKDKLAQKKYAVEQFFDEEGHLNDSGITLYVEALLLKRESELPEKMLVQVENCPHCQQEIVEFYQMMKEEDMSQLNPHPYLDRPIQQSWGQKIIKLAPQIVRVVAIFVFFVFVSLVYLLTSSPQYHWVSEISSPFQNQQIKVDFSYSEIQNSRAQTLELASGSTIFIPAYSFVNQVGKPVNGKVQINYREISKANDLIISGIPLKYDSVGKTHYFESAGIFEFRGSKNGEPVFIAPGKSITVKMASFQSEKNFSDYYLNEQKQKVKIQSSPLANEVMADNPKLAWQYLGKSNLISPIDLPNETQLETLKNQKMREAEVLEKEIQTRQNQLSEKSNLIPAKTIAPNRQQYFKLALNMKENPVLVKYEDQVWQYAGENVEESPTAKNEWIFREKWDDLRLIPSQYKSLSLKGHTAKVNSAVFSPDGNLIVTASADNTAKVWTKEAQYLLTLQGHTQSINSTVFSPDGRLILTASDDQTAKIWTKDGVLMATLQGHQKPIKKAVFSADGRLILTSSLDNTAKLWTIQGKLLRSFTHKNHSTVAQISPDSKSILTIPSDSLAKLWSLEGKEIAQLKGKFSSIHFAKAGKFILTASGNVATGQVGLWTNEGKLLRFMDLNDATAVFSPKSNHIFSLSGSTARLWYFNQKSYYSTQLISSLRNSSYDERKGHEGVINEVSFSEDGKYIITASQDKTARFWSEDGRLLYVLRGHTASVNSASISPDNAQMLTASDDFTAKIWQKRETDEVFELELVKKAHEVIEGRRKVIIAPGKKFYSVVKFGEAEIAEMKVKNPQPESNPLNQLMEQHEKLLTEIENLEKADNSPKKIFRTLQIKKCGIYQSARIYTVEADLAKSALLDLNKETQLRPVILYQITGEHKTAIIPYQINGNQLLNLKYNPSQFNQFLALLPNDQVLEFALPEFVNPEGKSNEDSQSTHLQLVNLAKINQKKDWDRLME